MTAEINADPPETEPDSYAVKESGSEERFSNGQQDNGEGAQEAEPAEEKQGMDEGIASDYVAPDRSRIVMPKAVAGRNGYQQV